MVGSRLDNGGRERSEGGVGANAISRGSWRAMVQTPPSEPIEDSGVSIDVAPSDWSWMESLAGLPGLAHARFDVGNVPSRTEAAETRREARIRT
jgi:hypothetical protein